LACEPSVLVADEPTTALDVMVQAQILELLDGLCRDFGLALVLVTHDLPVVAQLCDRAAVMYAGEIVEEGPMERLYHSPRHPYTPAAADGARRGRRVVLAPARGDPRPRRRVRLRQDDDGADAAPARRARGRLDPVRGP